MWICDGNNTEQLCIKPYGFLVVDATHNFSFLVALSNFSSYSSSSTSAICSSVLLFFPWGFFGLAVFDLSVVPLLLAELISPSGTTRSSCMLSPSFSSFSFILHSYHSAPLSLTSSFFALLSIFSTVNSGSVSYSSNLSALCCCCSHWIAAPVLIFILSKWVWEYARGFSDGFGKGFNSALSCSISVFPSFINSGIMRSGNLNC